MSKFIKITLVFALYLGANNCFAQINVGNDTIICAPGNVTLTATVTPSNGTTSYAVSNINYAPFPYNIGAVVNFPSNADDDVSNALPIGFNFCFFGNSYTQFYVGTNGWISFSPGQNVGGNTAPIPTGSFTVPRNCIMGVWEDWNMIFGGTVHYTTQGVAPFRRLIVSWDQAAMYQCTNNIGSFQIICYETTNAIDINILSKPFCNTWFNGNAVEGLHDATGTIAFPVPGRNSTQWSVTNDAYHFQPNGPPNPYTVNWFNMSNVNIGTGNSVTTNVPSTSTYYAIVNYACSNANDTDSVTVTVGIPINIGGVNLTCNGASNGSVGVSTNIPGPYTYVWNPGGGTTDTLHNLPAGSYTVTVTYGPCNYVDSITITEPPPTVNATTVAPDTCTQNLGTAGAQTNSGNGPFTYLWSTGATTSTISGLAAGSYTLITTDANGCTVQDVVVITDLPPPTAGFNYSPQTVTLIDPNVQFTDASNSATTWAWDFGDGNSSNAQNPNHAYTAEGTYTVTLIVTNAYGCSDTITQIVVVEGFYTFFVPSAFTPNGTGPSENNTFGPEFSGIDITSFNFYVYDRWGMQIFKTNDATERWNGKMHNTGNRVLEIDVYVYLFQFLDFKGDYHEVIGRVTLLGKSK